MSTRELQRAEVMGRVRSKALKVQPPTLRLSTNWRQLSAWRQHLPRLNRINQVPPELPPTKLSLLLMRQLLFTKSLPCSML